MNKQIRHRIIWTLVFSVCLTYVFQAQDQKVDPNGFNRFYYSDGVVSSEGNLKNGKPEGYWKNYFPSRVLKSEGNRKDHLLDSLWRFYNEEGILVEEINYRSDQRNGITRRYSKEGFLVSETPYVSDQKQGLGKEFFSNGAVQKEIPFEAGAINGEVFEFDQKGEIISITRYKNGIFIKKQRINRRNEEGKKEGLWKEFYEDRSVKAEGKYNNGRKDGYWKEYAVSGDLEVTYKFDKGQMITDAEELANLEIKELYYPDSDGKIKFRGTYREGQAFGTHIWYAITGEIDSVKVYRNDILTAEGDMTTNGLRIGEWKEYYYPEGELRSIGLYKDGYRSEGWEYYFRNGELEQKGKYGKKGLPEGTWNWFYEDGQLLREETFRSGKENGWLIEYDPSGKIITKGEYVDGKEEGDWLIEVGDHQEMGKYEYGLKQGEWQHYYLSNGALRFEGSFFDDLPQDKHTWYYDTGVKMLEGNYVSGVQDGEWRRYNPDGTVFVSIEYSSGNEVKVDGLKLKVKGAEDQ